VRQRVLLLLSFIHDPQTMRQAAERLARGQAATQALVIETLEVTLSGEQKRLVLALVDGSISLTRRIRELGVPYTQLTQDERLHEIISDTELWPYPWIRACAIYTAGKLARQSQASAIEKALLTSDPYIQETAVWALQNLAATDEQKQTEIGEVNVTHD